MNDGQADVMKDRVDEGEEEEEMDVALKTHMQSVYVILQGCTVHTVPTESKHTHMFTLFLSTYTICISPAETVCVCGAAYVNFNTSRQPTSLHTPAVVPKTSTRCFPIHLTLTLISIQSIFITFKRVMVTLLSPGTAFQRV